jgi:predicted Fe-Mo cluster-binding NifX family protein
MKICITSKGPSPISEMDDNFDNCDYLTFFLNGGMAFDAISIDKITDMEDKNIEQYLINRGIEVLITGKINPESLNVLKAANINVLEGIKGKLRDVVNMFRKGSLKKIS